MPLCSPQPVGPVSVGPRLSALSATAQSTFAVKEKKRNRGGTERQRERDFIKGRPSFQKAAVVSSVFCPSQLLVPLAARDDQWCTQPDLSPLPLTSCSYAFSLQETIHLPPRASSMLVLNICPSDPPSVSRQKGQDTNSYRFS